MAIGIKFAAGSSTGTAYETGETRTVNVTSELLTAVSGYEGDPITYTATILDSTTAKLPATFVADLKINGTVLVNDQVFNAGAYDQGTGLLTLAFTVPAGVGVFNVTLEWLEQII